MTENQTSSTITEVVWCDGTCELSPADHEREHPDPHAVLRAQLIETVQQRLGDQTELFPHAAEFLVDGVLADIEAHPVLEVRPYYPTKDAYDAACRALEEKQTVIDGVAARHSGPRTERYGSGCVQCGLLWPCPDAKAVGLRRAEADAAGE